MQIKVHNIIKVCGLWKAWGRVLAVALAAFVVVFTALRAESAQLVVTLKAEVDGAAEKGGYSYGPDLPQPGHPEIKVKLKAMETFSDGWVEADPDHPKPWEWTVDVAGVNPVRTPPPPATAPIATFQDWIPSKPGAPAGGGGWVNGALDPEEKHETTRGAQCKPDNAQNTELVIPKDVLKGKLGRWKIPAKVSHYGRARNIKTGMIVPYYREASVWVQFNVFTVETLGVYKADYVITDDYVMREDKIGEIHKPGEKADTHADKFPFLIPAFAKTSGPTVQAHEVTLVNAGEVERLGFPTATSLSKANGDWGGEAKLNGKEPGSEKAGDALIGAVVDGQRMPLLREGKNEFPATVFWFGGDMALKAKGKYELGNGKILPLYTIFGDTANDVACASKCSIKLYPEKLNFDAPQIETWRQTFVQNVLCADRRGNYVVDSVEWNPDILSGSQIEFPGKTQLLRGFSEPRIDVLPNTQPPLYSSEAISKPTNYGGSLIETNDTPAYACYKKIFKFWPKEPEIWKIKANYILSSIELRDRFTIWGVVYSEKLGMVVPVLECDWHLEVISSGKNQKATVGDAVKASHPPLTGGPIANTVIRGLEDVEGESGDMKKETKP